MQNRREKREVVLLTAAGLVGIVLLAAALGGFTFTAPYELLAESCTDAGDESSSELSAENCTDARDEFSYAGLLRLIVVFLAVLAPLLVYLVVRVPRYRRWVLLILLALFVVVYAIVAARPIPQLPGESAAGGSTVEAVQDEVGTPEPTLAPPPEPGTARVTPGLIWLLSLGMACLVLALAAAAYLFVRAYRTRTVSPLEIIVASAETALQALERGGDVREAILRCYSDMLATASERGVDKPGYLTPAEFIQRLVQAGLPPGAVERLTHLFEAVRYSPQPPTAVMEAEAVDCLRVVVQAARGNL